jgi:hypothetical protein
MPDRSQPPPSNVPPPRGQPPPIGSPSPSQKLPPNTSQGVERPPDTVPGEDETK